MKKTYQYIVLAVLTLGMVACTQEDDFAPQGNQKDTPLAIASAGVASLTTRATIDSENNLVGGSIGVFVTSSSGGRYEGSNIKWTYNNGWDLDAATVVLYENDDTKQQIGAYYPYTSDLTDEGKFAIELPEQFGSDYEDYDYLYANYAALNNNPATIAMNHLLSKITVSISTMGTELSNDAVQSISLFNVPRTASWEVPTSTLTDLGIANETTTLYANDTNDDEVVDHYVGYALPNAATTLGIRVTMDSGRSFAAQAPITDGLASGNHYLISMKLGKDAVTVCNITIGDWGTPENNVSGSEVTEIFIRSTVSGTTAAIDIVSSAAEGVQNAISELLTANPSVTTLTVNGTLNEVQQSALAAALAGFNGTLVMDMAEVADAISSLVCTKQLGGYTIATDGTTTTYTVYTEAGLNTWREAIEENRKTNLTLGADIILSTEGITVDENGKPSGSNWTATGIFEGTLDGGGRCIANLRIYSEKGSSACFIGGANNAAIKNLTLVTPVVYGTTVYTASLASQISRGTSIIDCHVQGGSVTGEHNGTGGLIAAIAYKTCYVYGCTNSAKVTGTQWVGGIIGTIANDGNVFAACANTGEISGNSNVGGIAGTPRTSENLIACYTPVGNLCGNTVATVTGSYYVASEDTDGEDGTTAVADATALNSMDVVTAMNAAIDTYNSSATKQVTYKWKVGTTLPELELVSE